MKCWENKWNELNRNKTRQTKLNDYAATDNVIQPTSIIQLRLWSRAYKLPLLLLQLHNQLPIIWLPPPHSNTALSTAAGAKAAYLFLLPPHQVISCENLPLCDISNTFRSSRPSLGHDGTTTVYENMAIGHVAASRPNIVCEKYILRLWEYMEFLQRTTMLRWQWQCELCPQQT